MFDVLNQWHAGSGQKQEYKGMVTFYELTGIDPKKKAGQEGSLITDTGERVDFFAMFGMGVPEKEAEKVENTGTTDLIDVTGTEVPMTKEEPDSGGETVQDTASLFGFFADTEFSGHLRKTNGKRKNQPKGMKQVINF